MRHATCDILHVYVGASKQTGREAGRHLFLLDSSRWLVALGTMFVALMKRVPPSSLVDENGRSHASAWWTDKARSVRMGRCSQQNAFFACLDFSHFHALASEANVILAQQIIIVLRA